MTHTPEERLSIYKEAHNQFQPYRTDAEDWEQAKKDMKRAVAELAKRGASGNAFKNTSLAQHQPARTNDNPRCMT